MCCKLPHSLNAGKRGSDSALTACCSTSAQLIRRSHRRVRHESAPEAGQEARAATRTTASVLGGGKSARKSSTGSSWRVPTPLRFSYCKFHSQADHVPECFTDAICHGGEVYGPYDREGVAVLRHSKVYRSHPLARSEGTGEPGLQQNCWEHTLIHELFVSHRARSSSTTSSSCR